MSQDRHVLRPQGATTRLCACLSWVSGRTWHEAPTASLLRKNTDAASWTDERTPRMYSIITGQAEIKMFTYPSVLSQLHEDEARIGSCRSPSIKIITAQSEKKKGAAALVKCQRFTLARCARVVRRDGTLMACDAGRRLGWWAWSLRPHIIHELHSYWPLASPCLRLLHKTPQELGVFLGGDVRLAGKWLKSCCYWWTNVLAVHKRGVTYSRELFLVSCEKGESQSYL